MERGNGMRHLLTVDVEGAWRGLASERGAGDADPQLPAAMDRLLETLHATGTAATFFVLGQDADRLHSVLERGVAAGHEVACHGMRHRRVDRMRPDEFRADLHAARCTLEEVVQTPCRGYRAPWFSAPVAADWYTDALREEGICYDAGWRRPVEMRLAGQSQGGLIRVPVPLLPSAAGRIGVLGGLALRVLPCVWILNLIRRCEALRQPACLYLHPYEWYTPPGRWNRSPGGPRGVPASARRAGPRMSAARRRLLTGRTLPRLQWLAERVELTTVANWLEERPRV